MGQVEKGTQANTTRIPIKIGKYRLSTKIIHQYAVIIEEIIPMQEDDNEKRSVIGGTPGNIICNSQILLYNSRTFVARIKTEQGWLLVSSIVTCGISIQPHQKKSQNLLVILFHKDSFIPTRLIFINLLNYILILFRNTTFIFSSFIQYVHF